eukprot:COSAG01_NODE_47441_length_390_cov_0.883162_1_plen_39_part_10
MTPPGAPEVFTAFLLGTAGFGYTVSETRNAFYLWTYIW